MKKLVIIGVGGVGREVALIVQQINQVEPTWDLIGFVDDNSENWNKVINGYSVLGGTSAMGMFLSECYVVIAIANYKVKKSIVEKLNGKFPFATLVHPRVFIHDYIKIGKGTIIYEGVVLTANIEIGDHAIISPKCGVGHDTVIKDFVSLLWNVNISGADIIEEGTMVGSGATIIQGKTIGKGSTIGAGSVVIDNIPSYSTVVGVPGKVIKRDEIVEKEVEGIEEIKL